MDSERLAENKLQLKGKAWKAKRQKLLFYAAAVPSLFMLTLQPAHASTMLEDWSSFLGSLAGLAVLGMGFRKISTLPLTETELFFATLLVLAVALQAICLGLLVSKAGQHKQEKSGTPA